MTIIDVNSFSEEKQCTYNGELYSVRDNGAVLRHSRQGKRVRPNDNKWTFGKENKNNPYLHISNIRIHRIVATAFHGDPPDPKYVVDHIDTNCRNNRPDNLRWLTRLENTLKNPFTRKKIEFLCGSIEAFLENPSILSELNLEPNFAWMRTVTPEEAQNCKDRMNLWLNKPTKNSNHPIKNAPRARFEKSIYKPLKRWEVFGREPGLDLSNTPRCGQYMWNGSFNFPQCPDEFLSNPIIEYFESLSINKIFSYSENEALILVDKIYVEDICSIIVLNKTNDSKFTVAGIQLDSDTGYFIHFNFGFYSTEIEADKVVTRLKKKKDWWGASISLSFQNRG